MTVEEMRYIFKEQIPLNILTSKIDSCIFSGIHEFHIVNNKSIGVCYELNEDGIWVYYFNLFLGEEYIDIAENGFTSIYDAIDIITREWNKLEELEEKL